MTQQTTATDAEIAEWVGLHYGLNFDAASEAAQAEWRRRYTEAHEPEGQP